MFAQTFGSTALGINGVLITVEVDIANGIPGFDIVGLPDASVRESKERVRAAIKNAGFEFPTRRITVNLAPADLKKDGSGLDLPIALGILAATGQISSEVCNTFASVGELSLDGKIRGVPGVLPMAVSLLANGITRLFTACQNTQEALLAGNIEVFGVDTLEELVRYLQGEIKLAPSLRIVEEHNRQVAEDFADVQGQLVAKRALEVAAAGGHNALLVGPPGSGKTMLARRIPTILPTMSREEALEVTKIASVSGLYNNRGGLITERPFRNPHHTISDAGLIGGGRIPKPGEVTLSHYGVLFLDELPEFPRNVLEALRQPLEDGQVNISRVNATLTYPAKFMLVAAMNPCPCGFLGDESTPCNCSQADLRRYLRKISGPLLDRIDIQVRAPRPKYSELTTFTPGEPSAVIRERVQRARNAQRERLQRFGIGCNAQMGHRHVKATCQMTTLAQDVLRQAFTKLNLSARGYDRIIKVARTIADLEAADRINELHIAEAVQYRSQLADIFV